MHICIIEKYHNAGADKNTDVDPDRSKSALTVLLNSNVRFQLKFHLNYGERMTSSIPGQ